MRIAEYIQIETDPPKYAMVCRDMSPEEEQEYLMTDPDAELDPTVEDIANMAYINSEIALAILEMEIE